MEQINKSDLEDLLGIFSPWHIHRLEKDDDSGVIYLKLNSVIKQGNNTPYDVSNFGENNAPGSWQYVNIGAYRCIIQADIPHREYAPSGGIDKKTVMLPSFLGNPHCRYSNYLRQQVALYRMRGLDDGTISSVLGISENLAVVIAQDIEKSAGKLGNLMHLPTEIDPVWISVLSDKLQIETNILPLKFLLSKLKISVSMDARRKSVMNNIVELRKFFLGNAALANNEIDQLCGITSETLRKRVNAVKAKQRLILPSTGNTVWVELILGKINLNSKSVPLNLLISKQRLNYVRAMDGEQKTQTIETIRQYFKLNYRSLKDELIFINKRLHKQQKTVLRLPSPDHDVWQKIIEDDDFVHSDHVAYKLLLAKLRSDLSKNMDPVYGIEAARRIRKFLQQNQKNMHRELTEIFKRSAAI